MVNYHPFINSITSNLAAKRFNSNGYK